MYDNYFKPTSYKIKAGQTVKFIVENKGQFVQEILVACNLPGHYEDGMVNEVTII